MTRIRKILMLGAVAACLMQQGCFVAGIVSAAGANIERDKKIKVPARYTGLNDKTVAVLVNADMATLYENPTLVSNLVTNLTTRIGREMKPFNVRVMRPIDVLNWQYTTPAWSTIPYGEIAAQLGVDRVILVDVFEYRLNPPGNRWIWEGVCGGTVSIIERDGIEPDAPADEFQVSATFPVEKNLTADNASSAQVATGLQIRFIEKVAWLFYDHEEFKYPEELR